MTLKNDDITRVLFIIVSIFFLLLSTPIFTIAPEKLAMALLGFVITVGLSHGSLDWALARHWGIRHSITESLLFLILYVAVGLVALGIWWMTPATGLIIFLLMSILHFASDWNDELGRPVNIILGIAVVTLPGVMFENQVLAHFKLLISEQDATVLSHYVHYAGCIGMIGASLIAVLQIKISPLLSAEIITLIIVGIILPPIIYFSIYFCMLHTIKHWLRMKRIGLYRHFFHILWSATWPTAICIIVGFWVYNSSTVWSFSHNFIRIVFMGLAALTVPHWLLLEIYPLMRKHKRIFN